MERCRHNDLCGGKRIEIETAYRGKGEGGRIERTGRSQVGKGKRKELETWASERGGKARRKYILLRLLHIFHLPSPFPFLSSCLTLSCP